MTQIEEWVRAQQRRKDAEQYVASIGRKDAIGVRSSERLIISGLRTTVGSTLADRTGPAFDQALTQAVNEILNGPLIERAIMILKTAEHKAAMGALAELAAGLNDAAEPEAPEEEDDPE